VSLFLDDPQRFQDTTHTTVDAGHGRIETRTASVSADIGWIREQHQWPGLATIGKVVRRREVEDKITTETAYICSAARSRPRGSPRSHAPIGASRTGCTGCSTSR
jgi:hypothetical protein